MRRQLSARALALALAVGLGGVLIGLSIAPRVMPGDTFRLKPRAAASAKADRSTPNLARPVSDLDHGSVLIAIELLAIVAAPIALVAGPGALVRLRSRRGRALVRALTAAGCRGPPAFS